MVDVELPDFDKMLEQAEKIKTLLLKRDVIELQIKDKVALIFQKVLKDPTYFMDGKRPSIAQVEHEFEWRGLEGELLPLRLEYAKLNAELSEARQKFSIYEMQVAMYQTESANKRASL